MAAILVYVGKTSTKVTLSKKAGAVLNQRGQDHSGSISISDFIFLKKIYILQKALIMNEGIEMFNFMRITHLAIDTT